MSLLETIRSAHGGSGISNVGRRHGLSESETERAIEALVPELRHAFRRHSTFGRTGAPAIHAAIEDPRHEHFIDDPGTLEGPEAQDEGERILADLLGAREADSIARHAAKSSGIAEGKLRELLPTVTAMMMGALTKQVRGSKEGSGQRESDTPTVAGHFGTYEESSSGATLARGLAALFGDEEVSIDKKP